MHPLTQQIMTQYPHPVPAHTGLLIDARPEAYCIGGACCLTFPEAVKGVTPRRFPNPRDLAEWLVALNPQLDDWRAFDLAGLITHNNDAGHFSRAWRLVDQALTYGHQE